MRARKRLTALLVVVALLVIAMTPPRARADSTTEVIAITAGVMVGMMAVALLVTAIDRSSPPIFQLAPQPPDGMDDRSSGQLQFGAACRTSDGSLPVACW